MIMDPLEGQKRLKSCNEFLTPSTSSSDRRQFMVYYALQAGPGYNGDHPHNKPDTLSVSRLMN